MAGSTDYSLPILPSSRSVNFSPAQSSASEAVSTDLAKRGLADTLAKVARGDQAAFEQLYATTNAKLMGVCVRVLNDREAAEDVLQDAYVTIWAKAHLFDESMGSPMTWMAAITRNRSIDEFRRSRRSKVTETLDGRREFVDAARLACELLEARDESILLQRSLKTLGHQQRDEIQSAFYEDMTYFEVSQRYNVAQGTMKSRIRRSLQRLKVGMVRDPAV